MITAPKHPCAHPGCGALLAAGAGRYCPGHQRAPRQEARAADRFRGTAHERGYNSRWEAARLGFLARYPICAGVLIPTAAWTPSLAMEFHDLREAARERGELLVLCGARVAVHISSLPLRRWINAKPIYICRDWDVGQGATVVDHIIPHRGDPDLFWAEWNWQAITKRAHDRKTATEDRGGNARGEPPRE